MKTIWLNREELMEVTRWSARTVLRKSESGDLRPREAGGRHRNGKPVLEYSASSLSARQRAAAQRLVARRGQAPKRPGAAEESKTAQLALFSPQTPSVVPIRGAVTAARIEEIENRFNPIAPLEDIFQKPKNRQFPHRMKDGTTVRTWTQAYDWCATQSHQSARNIQRAYAAYRKFGKPALARKKRCDAKTSRFFVTHPKAAYLVAYLFLEHRQSCRVAHEALVRDAERLEIPADEVASYDTVRAFLKSMPPSLAVFAREGKKIYRERMSPFLKRGFEDVYANEIWVGDHSILDVECQNDCFNDAEIGAPIRVRMSAFIDYRSRFCVGATFCWEGSSLAIAACMRRGIAKYGPPEQIYCDNGRDYRKVARGAVRGNAKEAQGVAPNWTQMGFESIGASGFLARLNIAVTHCIPHHPQSKCIERFFRTVHERYDRLWPTYTSGSPFTRPETTEKAMMQHRRLVKAGRVAESKHPLASQFILGCVAWLEEYADTPHRGQGMKGATPRQVFEANLNPAQKPIPDPAILALLMAEHVKRQVRECTVTVANHRYTPIDQQGWASMHYLNEREVIVAYDPGDLDNVAVRDEDGDFVAWLEREDLVRFAPHDPKTQSQIADSMATRRRLEKGNRDCVELVARAARANGAVSPLEAMANRLRLSDGETGRDVVTQRAAKRTRNEESIKVPVTPAEAARRFFVGRKALSRRANADENADAIVVNPTNLIPGQAAERLAVRIKRSRSGTGANADEGANDEFDSLEAVG